MKANAYDFDKTIYDGDTTAGYYWYCVRRRPFLILCLPAIGLGHMLRICGVKREKCKRFYYCFFRFAKDPVQWAEAFWDKEMGKIKPWYLAQKQKSDIVLTESPEFLIAPIMRRLGIERYFATEMDPKTAVHKTLCCRGEEKVRRLRERYPDVCIEEFYSDSQADAPMARVAKRSFLIVGNEILPWKWE